MRFRGNRGGARKVVISAVFIFICFLIFFEMRIRPMSKNLVSTESQRMASEAVNEAVNEVLTELGFTYNDLTHFEYSNDNKIQSVRTDVVNINKIKALVALRAQEKIENIHNREVNVPIGNFLGGELFQGKGPGYKLYISLTGSINITFDSNFMSAGINQTLHRIELNVISKIVVACPGYSENTVVKTNAIIAESVLVGDVPLLYSEAEKEAKME